MGEIKKVNLREKLSGFDEHWKPKVVGELNGQHVRLVKVSGEFVWHHHDDEDEMFLVIEGTLRMEFRKDTVTVKPGEFIIVPRGVEHRPVAADGEVHMMLFEPASTVNTGNAGGERTTEPERI